MKLIILYGPPAVGKLTVAKILSEKTGIKIFHNHVSIDLLSEYFKRSKATDKIVTSIRKQVFEEAAKQNIDLIFTVVYASKVDDEYVDDLISPVIKNHGEVYFVQLTCNREELMKRVENDSRKSFTKIQTRELLNEILEENELFDLITGKSSVIIDNTNLSPEFAADRIIDELKLK